MFRDDREVGGANRFFQFNLSALTPLCLAAESPVVRDGLNEIRGILGQLVAKRDARKDAFAKVLGKAMSEKLGEDAEAVSKVLSGEGIPKELAKSALELATKQGRFTIFSLVDALTRLTQSVKFIGDRTELDQKIGKLLTLAT